MPFAAPRAFTLPFTLVAVLLATSCGGDNSDGPPTGLVTDADPGIGGGSGSPPSLGLNGPLTGQLLFGDNTFDLVTGRRGPDFPSSALSAAPDGRTFYYVRRNCRDRPERLSLSYDCVVVLDAAGTEIDELDPALDLSTNAPSVSPDGRFLAVDTTEIVGTQSVVVLGPGGEILDEADRASNVERVDWGPDGALHYVADGALWRASVGDDPSDDTLVLRFDEADGIPLSVRVSPDGATLAVELDTSTDATDRSAAVWLVNADGSGLRRFATAESLPEVRRPRWSPDGRRLLVSAGGFNRFTGAPTPLDIDLGGSLFALDTSLESHSLDDLGTASTPEQVRIVSDCGAESGPCKLDADIFVTRWLP